MEYESSIKKYHSQLNEWKDKGLLEQEEYGFLFCRYPKLPALYLLPKIHKKEADPPGRPIVSSRGSCLENTSKYVDFFLQTFVQSLPSYVKDTGDFLRQLEGIEWKEEYSLLCLDVVGLYTCIPHDLGLQACRQVLKERSISYLLHTEVLIDMMSVCLKQNYFIFDGRIYQQTLGTSMGTCFAPCLAGLYLGYWEEKIIKEIQSKKEHVIMWARYIDDIFCIWKGSEADANDFVKTLNSNEFNLEFTSQFSKNTIEFLDLELTVNENKLESRLFRKKNAGNSLLHARSCHSNALIRSIPYGKLLHAKRNCSTQESYEREETMTDFWREGTQGHSYRKQKQKSQRDQECHFWWKNRKILKIQSRK